MDKIDPHYTCAASSFPYVMSAETMRFVSGFPGDSYCFEHKGSIVASFHDVVRDARDFLGPAFSLKFMNQSNVMLEGDRALITIMDMGSTSFEDWEDEDDGPAPMNLWTSAKRDIIIQGYGDAAILKGFFDGWATKIRLSRNPQIEWHYLFKDSRAHTTVYLQKPRVVDDAYYPWMTGGVDAYIDRFLASDSAVLIMRGEPGTGKTSFIQHLVWRSGTNAMITYEEQLFRSDDLFQHFMTSRNVHLLLMEDADQFLLSRERDGNATMAKFLNVADGILHFPQKKLIISTNIVDVSKIDSALLRPGRCFDNAEFRRLTYPEAVRAAEQIGVAPPAEVRDYTLAELFAGRAQSNTSFGFLS